MPISLASTCSFPENDGERSTLRFRILLLNTAEKFPLPELH